MESIEIKNFLTIEYAKFEIKKINVLIGAQAQGKSVIAKLVYFFKKEFLEIFTESVKRSGVKRDINKKCLASFEQVFPSYAWKNQEFSINYDYGEYQVSISRTQKNNRYTTKFDCCAELMSFHNYLKQRLSLDLEAALLISGGEKKESYRETLFNLMISQESHNPKISFMLEKSFFIPAGRSFFAHLQRNIFSFLASNINIDPLMKEFGSYYESLKTVRPVLEKNYLNIDAKIDQLVGGIVAGEYLYADEQDWITNQGQKTNLANASSGQQESLPMLLMLKIMPFLHKGNPLIFFIEEPEAHLFPTSQKQIISLIAILHNELGNSFFITTHSPYILTAINNLVVGKDAYDHAQGNPEKLEALEKVLPADELIRLEDVSAYTLKNGKLESIINWENRLIGANLLDAVSDEFDTAFGVATEILYGDD